MLSSEECQVEVLSAVFQSIMLFRVNCCTCSAGRMDRESGVSDGKEPVHLATVRLISERGCLSVCLCYSVLAQDNSCAGEQ